jgi:hypothetical protein
MLPAGHGMPFLAPELPLWRVATFETANHALGGGWRIGGALGRCFHGDVLSPWIPMGIIRLDGGALGGALLRWVASNG